ncbi:hypothetical protein QVD17_32019 [Tagetes erecta]|uniref:RDRP C-terminal head domain-containing protein n=1 Tax=Tagetes erecta TaxID=13708 RepID=A0AAD8KB18_TARER|nr:hypothetical protein QVD17_32019 [Tagetes erecta]
MNYYGINTEAELVTGSIMKMSKSFDRRNDAEAVDYWGRYSEEKTQHFLSFPWCVRDKHIEIKKQKACAKVVHNHHHHHQHHHHRSSSFNLNHFQYLHLLLSLKFWGAMFFHCNDLLIAIKV